MKSHKTFNHMVMVEPIISDHSEDEQTRVTSAANPEGSELAFKVA